MMPDDSARVIVPVMVGLVALGLGFFLGYWVLRRLFRNMRVQYVAYIAGGLCQAVTGTRLARLAWWTLGIAAVALVRLAWQERTLAVVVGLGLLTVYQVVRRGALWRKWIGVVAEVGRILNADPEAFEHIVLRVVYQIRMDRRDHWTRSNLIRARKPSAVMKGVRVGVTPGSGKVSKFSALAVSAWTDKGQLIPVPGEYSAADGRRQELHLVMTEPMKVGECRELVVTGTWFDMWGPLRSTGKDEGILRLVRPVGHLEIMVVFPANVKVATMTRIQPKDAGDVTSGQDAHGRLFLAWQIEDAKALDYNYTIVCDELAAVRASSQSEGDGGRPARGCDEGKVESPSGTPE